MENTNFRITQRNSREMFANQINRPSMRYIVNFNNTDYDPNERVPELWENETLDFSLDRVELSFTNDSTKVEGVGKLYITSKRVLWISPTKAYDFDVPYITLHAVSKDPQTYPKPCVYCQTDVEEDAFEDINDDEEEGNEDQAITEFFLAPEEDRDLQSLFDALSHAALINPDPEDEEDNGDDDFIFNVDEVRLGAEQARVLDHLESVFQFPDEGESNQPNKRQKNNDEGNSTSDSGSHMET